MAKRKKVQYKAPPMVHAKDFEKYLEKKPKVIIGTHCGFKLTNQIPLYRIDNLETVQL